MNYWMPSIKNIKGGKTKAILSALRKDVLSGVLKPNQQIPPLRAIASDLGLNAATVKRAFDQAEREGLIERHVGKGTFVKAEPEGLIHPFQSNDRFLDMATNGPPILSNNLLRNALEKTLAPLPNLNELFRYHKETEYTEHRSTIAFWAQKHGVSVDLDSIVVTPGAQAAIAAALLVSVGRNSAIAVEEMTYPGFTSACKSLGIEMCTVRSDKDGPLPDNLEAVLLKNKNIKALFIIPRSHNPTTRSISKDRAVTIAKLVQKYKISIIEDDSYIGPKISDKNPIFHYLCPTHTFYISGFSKVLQPGLRIAYLIPPTGQLTAAQAVAKALNYSVSPLLLELIRQWILDGTATSIYNENIQFFKHRHNLANKYLDGLNFSSDVQNAQIWLELPDNWLPIPFAEAARSDGILVSPAESFYTIDNGVKGSHIRLCVGSISNQSNFEHALQQVVALINSTSRFTSYDP